MRELLFVAMAIALAGSGCAFNGKQALLADDFRTENVEIPLGLTRVKVVDRRTGVSSGTLVSFAKENQAIRPQLTGVQKTLIQSELARYFKGTSRSVTVNVEVLKAEQQIETNWKGERESVLAQLKVTIIDAETQQPLANATGETTLAYQSMDASEEFMGKLYEKGLKVCLYNAARQLGKSVAQ